MDLPWGCARLKQGSTKLNENVSRRIGFRRGFLHVFFVKAMFCRGIFMSLNEGVIFTCMAYGFQENFHHVVWNLCS